MVLEEVTDPRKVREANQTGAPIPAPGAALPESPSDPSTDSALNWTRQVPMFTCHTKLMFDTEILQESDTGEDDRTVLGKLRARYLRVCGRLGRWSFASILIGVRCVKVVSRSDTTDNRSLRIDTVQIRYGSISSICSRKRLMPFRQIC